jgi:hypothetical protein
VNGVAITGATNQTFTFNLSNGDVVKCQTTVLCPSSAIANSNTITISQSTVVPVATVVLSSGNNPGCSDQLYTFSAGITTGGTSPSYQWQVNGSNVGSNAPTYTSTHNNGDVITCQVTSNSLCASPTTVTSNAITVVQTGMTSTVTLAVTQGTNPSCAGKNLAFLAQTINAGSSPSYKWVLNGAIVVGADSNKFSSSTFTTGDHLYCVVTSTDPCVLNPYDTSNTVNIIVNPSVTPNIYTNIIHGSNPGCLDSPIIFAVTSSNIGNNPRYIWHVNNLPVDTGAYDTTKALLNGDTVTCFAIATDGGCYTHDTVVSSSMIMTLYVTPNPPLVSLVSGVLVTNATGIITWWGPNGLIPGADSQSYVPTVPGYYWAFVSNTGCMSGQSNVILIVILGIENLATEIVKVFPNPTTGKVDFDWGTLPVNVNIDIYNVLGQNVSHTQLNNESHKTVDLSALSNGNYFAVIRDERGRTGAVKIYLQK